jgi:hypothetical protein
VNPAPKSIGLIMVLYGAIAVAFAVQTGKSPGPLGIAVSLALVAGGVLLLLQRPIAYWVAIGAGLFTFVAGIASTKLPPGLAMPVQPIIPIVIGLYICMRVAIAKSALTGRAAQRDRDREEETQNDS